MEYAILKYKINIFFYTVPYRNFIILTNVIMKYSKLLLIEFLCIVTLKDILW